MHRTDNNTPDLKLRAVEAAALRDLRVLEAYAEMREHQAAADDEPTRPYVVAWLFDEPHG